MKAQAQLNSPQHARRTAGHQSSENSFVTPSNKTTSKSARPKTGDGFISGSRSVAMMSSKKGSTTEQAGKIAARSSGASMLLLNLIPVFSASGWNSFTSQMLTAAKKTTNAPSRKNEADRPVRSEGILKMSSPVAASVSNSTASTGNNVAVSTASAIASTSTSKMNGQTINESSASVKTGTNTSPSARTGKIWFAQVWVGIPRRRWRKAGMAEWTTAKMK